VRKYSNFLILLIIVLFPIKVDALSCLNSMKVKYQNMARNIAYSYDAKEVKGKTVFTLIFSNVPSSLAINNASKGGWYYRNKNGEIVISNLNANTNYRYDVYAIDKQGCDNISLYSFNIILPYYNKYYTDPLCKGIENYSLCQKWINVVYEYDDWVNKIEKYKKSLIIEEEIVTPEEKRESIIEKIVDFYGKIYYIIFPIIIIAGLLTIYVYNKKRELF